MNRLIFRSPLSKIPRPQPCIKLTTRLHSSWGTIDLAKVCPAPVGQQEWQNRFNLPDSFFYDDIKFCQRPSDVLKVALSTKLPWNLEEGLFFLQRINELTSAAEVDLNIFAQKDFRKLVKLLLQKIPTAQDAANLITLMTLFADTKAQDGIRGALPWMIQLKEQLKPDDLAFGWFSLARSQQTLDENTLAHLVPTLERKLPLMSGTGVFCVLRGKRLLQIKPWQAGKLQYIGEKVIGENIPKLPEEYAEATRKDAKKFMWETGNLALKMDSNTFLTCDQALVLLLDFKRKASKAYELAQDPALQYEKSEKEKKQFYLESLVQPKALLCLANIFHIHLESLPYQALEEITTTFKLFGAKNVPFFKFANRRMKQFSYYGDPNPGRTEAPKQSFPVRKPIRVAVN